MNSISRREYLSVLKNIIFSFLTFGITPFSSFGKNIVHSPKPNEDRKNGLLVLYASFHGSTAQIAEFMVNKLSAKGITASIKSINDEIDFSSYSGLIMGAPIHR